MAKSDLRKEIVSNYTHFEEFMSYLPNPLDTFLNNPSDASTIFEEMLLDPHISSKIEQLKDEVQSKEFYIEPFDNSQRAMQIAQYVESVLENIDIESVISDMLSSVEYGYSVLEVIWKLNNQEWTPDKIKQRRYDLFRFKSDGTLVYKSPHGDKPLDTEYKFIVHKYRPSPKRIYGTPVLAQCYWPWQFKKAGLRFWLTVAEKFGVPTIFGIFNSEGLSEEEVKERADFIAEALYNIQSDAAIALPDVEIKSVESKGTADDFLMLLEFCNAEISKAITGEILTADKGKTGSYALAKVHSETLKKRGRKLSKSIANTLNQTLIKWIVELNFGKDAPVPSFNFDFSEVAEWDQVKDAIDRGIPVSKKAIYQQYNVPEPEDDNDSFISPKLNNPGGEGFSDFFTQMLRRMNLR